MNSFQHRRRTIAGAALGATLLALVPTSASAKICKSFSVTGPQSSTQTFVASARQDAQKRWRAKVNTTAGLGSAWSLWALARNASHNCVRPKVFQWRCTATAQPCRP